jgi:prophage regulatory protein
MKPTKPRLRRVIPVGGERLLSLKAVMVKVELGKDLIHAKVKDGSFPQPRRVSEGCRRWVSSEVDAWIEELPRDHSADLQRSA